MFLIKDKRQKLIDLIKEIIKEDIKLDDHWQDWVDSEEHLTQVDREVIHLLLHFVKDKKLIFREGYTSDEANNLIEIMNGYLNDIQEFKKKYEEIGETDRHNISKILERQVKLLLDAVHKDDDEIKKEIEKEFGITEGPDFDDQEDNFRVEYHPRVKAMKFVDGEYTLSEENEPFLFIYDNDYLVAAIKGDLEGRTFKVRSTPTEITKFHGYVARAIKLMFQKGSIDTFISAPEEKFDSDDARMYEDFKNDPKYHVETDKLGEFRVTLEN